MNSITFRDTRDYAHYETGVRESMQVLPSWLQRPLTWLTGHAIDGQKPIVNICATYRLVITLTFGLGLMILMTWQLLDESKFLWILVVPYWILITGILRSLQLVYGHHAIHGSMSSSKSVNELCAILCTTLPLVMNENDYRRTHLSHHRYESFCTENDDDSKFLVALGFCPGVSRRRLWWRFLTSLFNPNFHWIFLKARFISNFMDGSAGTMRRIFSVAWVCVLAAYSYSIGFLGFMVVIFIPMFILYNFSALINFMTEHSWMNEQGMVQSKPQYASKCWGRFCGQRYPARSGVFHKVLWWMVMLGYHLPVRLFALIGDVTVHDVHHLYNYPAQRENWVYDIYRRQELIKSDTRGMAQREVWGLHNAIDSVFIGISQRNF